MGGSHQKQAAAAKEQPAVAEKRKDASAISFKGKPTFGKKKDQVVNKGEFPELGDDFKPAAATKAPK
jgi:hypothetical protein